MSSHAHAPARARAYFSTHEDRMAQFRARGFVRDDTLEIQAMAGYLKFSGNIACLGNIVIRVWKSLEVLEMADDPLVVTRTYAYNAFFRGRGNILRVDNIHEHPGHADGHHKHRYDWRSGEELAISPEWIGEGKWPLLGTFIEEIEDFYWTVANDLADRDAFPDLSMLRDESDS